MEEMAVKVSSGNPAGGASRGTGYEIGNRVRLLAAPLTFAIGLSLATPAAVALPIQAAGADAEAPALSRNVLTVGGRDRSYSYYISSKYRPDAYNFVVYVLPDDGQTAEQFAEQSGWVKLAEEQGFVVVFLGNDDKKWAANSGGEDAYVKAVYDHATTHLTVRAPGQAAGGGRGGGARGGGEGGGGDRVGPAPGGAAPAARGQGGDPRMQGRGAARAQTWVPFHYVTGAGAGARVAQEFVLNHPGVFAAIATLDGGAYDAAFTKGDEPAQGYFQDLRGGKNARPVWKQLKKDVPVAAWLFTTGAPSRVETRQVDYWKRSDAVAPAARGTSFGGLQTAVYSNPTRAAEQVRTTVLGASANYDPAIASTVWNDFFRHVARWTSSPNGDVGPMLTEDEVNKTFDVKTADVDGKTYKYYIKTPTSYRKGQSLPVVLSAHGAFFPAWLYLNQIRMHEVGEKEGFITVYLNGQQNRWDFTDPDGADARYIKQVIDDLATSYGADRSRVYMQGFSLGSGMSYMMGITHPDLFAAVSPNNGIGPMSDPVQARVKELKAKSDVRIPMMIVYGSVDAGGSTDAKVPAQGVLRGAIDEMKRYNGIATVDRTVRFTSPNTAPYDVLVLGGKTVGAGIDARYPLGRFQVTQYSSSDAKPLNLFNFVWVTDLSHGGDPREAQLEWDYFKQWQRNPDGSLRSTAR